MAPVTAGRPCGSTQMMTRGTTNDWYELRHSHSHFIVLFLVSIASLANLIGCGGSGGGEELLLIGFG
ncbi:hypothetical protein Tco_0996592 [Tanacetum coccineum]